MTRLSYFVLTSCVVFTCVTRAGGQPTTQPTTAPSVVAAEIRGETVTWGEVRAIKKLLLPNRSDKRIINYWKLSTILADEFRKSGLLDDPEAKQAAKLLEKKLMADVYVLMTRLRATVTDEDARAYYDGKSQGRQFREPGIVTIKVIATKERENLDKIKARLVGGEDFDAVMNEHAETTLQVTGLSAVVIKDTSPNVLRPKFGAQAYALSGARLNEPVGPRRIPNGFMIFKVVSREMGQLKPFEQVREQIKRQLLKNKRKSVVTKLIRAAEKEAGIERKPPPRRAISPRTQRRHPATSTRPVRK